METFAQLDAPRDLAKIFDTTEYARWKGFRQSEDSRYVCLTLPHVLLRVPYGKETKPVDAFHYEEASPATIIRNICGATRPTRWAPASPTRSRVTDGARRFAAWKAAGWSIACRPIPSTPNRATSR